MRQADTVEIGVALAKPRNTPSPRLRGEGRVRGSCDDLSPQADELKSSLSEGVKRLSDTPV